MHREFDLSRCWEDLGVGAIFFLMLTLGPLRMGDEEYCVKLNLEAPPLKELKDLDPGFT